MVTWQEVFISTRNCVGFVPMALTKPTEGLAGEDRGEGMGVKGPSGWQVKDEPGLDMWELCTIDTPLET